MIRLWLLCCGLLFAGAEGYQWLISQAWFVHPDLGLPGVLLGGITLAIASNFRSLRPLVSGGVSGTAAPPPTPDLPPSVAGLSPAGPIERGRSEGTLPQSGSAKPQRGETQRAETGHLPTSRTAQNAPTRGAAGPVGQTPSPAVSPEIPKGSPTPSPMEPAPAPPPPPPGSRPRDRASISFTIAPRSRRRHVPPVRPRQSPPEGA